MMSNLRDPYFIPYLSAVAVVQMPHPCGGEERYLKTQDELDRFKADPEGFIAGLYGATVEQYRDWIKTEGTPRCSALTVKGRPCRNFVSGGIQQNFSDWVRQDRIELCAVHGGRTSNEAREDR